MLGWCLTLSVDILSAHIVRVSGNQPCDLRRTGKRKKVGSRSGPAYLYAWLHLGEQLQLSGVGGGISQVRPFNLHVRARSCRAITTGTLYQLHRSGSVRGRHPHHWGPVAVKHNGTY